MMSRSIIKLMLAAVFFILSLYGCASPPDKKSSNYWRDKANNYLTEGVGFYNDQRYDEAYKRFNLALDTYQRFNAVSHIVDVRFNLAKTAIALNDLDDALSHYELAEYTVNAHDLQDKSDYLAIVKSTIDIELNHYDQAKQLLDDYLTRVDGAIKQAMLLNRTRLAFLLKENESEWLEKLSMSFTQDTSQQGRLLYYRAMLAYRDGNYTESDRYYNQALEVHRKTANIIGVITVLQDWGETLFERQQWQKASIRYEDLYTTSTSLKRNDLQEISLNALVEIYQQLKDDQKYHWAAQQRDQLLKR